MQQPESIPGVYQEFPFERTLIVGNWVKEFARNVDRSVLEHGLSLGIKNVLEKKGGKIRTVFDDPTTKERFLKNDARIIVVSTHATLAEPFAILASLAEYPVSSQLRFFMADGAPQLPNLNAFVIPLYNTVNIHEFRPDTTIFRVLGGTARHVDEAIARDVNRKQFEFAAEYLNNGGSILIFPEGNRPKAGEWPPGGIGRLLAYTGDKHDALVVFAEAFGSGPFDLAGIVSPFSLGIPFRNTEVHFSEPLSVAEIMTAGDNDKALMTVFLKEQYNHWLRFQ